MNSGTIKKNIDINYNLDYLVVVPNKDIDLLDAFNYTFGNTILFSNEVEDVEFLIEFLKKNTIGKLIFVDYYGEYEEVINTLVDEHDIKFIFTGYLGELSDEMVLYEYNQICNKYDCNAISEIAFLDYNLYKVVHRQKNNTRHLVLDIKKKNKNDDDFGGDSIGILNSDDSNYDSFYNELSSFTFLPNYYAKVLNPTRITLGFAKEYNLKIKGVDNQDALVANNVCNLDINFTGTSPVTFVKSMDTGVLCVIGNNDFLVGYPVLEKYLVMESDDDINEMAERIAGSVKNRNVIMEEYKKFRDDYSARSKKLAEEFLGISLIKDEDEKYEKLLTVVVPVYNTEEYLAGSLDSIIQAAIPEMEILIINDGSTDNSEKIAKEYQNKYPDLIRYIKQDNHGLGNVRNVGLEKSRGKYLASVDSDDTIQPRFFRDALPFLADDVDVVICDWMSVSNEKSFETVALDWVFRTRKKMEGILYTTIMPSTCNKIMKKSLFLRNNIHYLEQKYEDLSANPLVLLKSDTIKYLHKPYYNYYLRDNSLMRSKINPRQMTDVISFLDSRLKVSNEAINLDEFKYYTYSWRIEEYIINPLYDMKGEELEKAIDYIYKKIYEIVVDTLCSDYYNKMLDSLKADEMRKYIKERNKAFIDKKMKEFIKRAKNPCKLNAGIIYYGD